MNPAAIQNSAITINDFANAIAGQVFESFVASDYWNIRSLKITNYRRDTALHH